MVSLGPVVVSGVSSPTTTTASRTAVRQWDRLALEIGRGFGGKISFFPNPARPRVCQCLVLLSEPPGGGQPPSVASEQDDRHRPSTGWRVSRRSSSSGPWARWEHLDLGQQNWSHGFGRTGLGESRTRTGEALRPTHRSRWARLGFSASAPPRCTRVKHKGRALARSA